MSEITYALPRSLTQTLDRIIDRPGFAHYPINDADTAELRDYLAATAADMAKAVELIDAKRH